MHVMIQREDSLELEGTSFQYMDAEIGAFRTVYLRNMHSGRSFRFVSALLTQIRQSCNGWILIELVGFVYFSFLWLTAEFGVLVSHVLQIAPSKDLFFRITISY